MPMPSQPSRFSRAIELRAGARLTREQFHEAYQQSPEGFRAELIAGIVHLAGRATITHANTTLALEAIIARYESATPGVEGAAHATVLLSADAEPEPDMLMRILPEYGGQTSNSSDDYIVGPPELIIEVASDLRSIEFHEKLEDYRRAGVQEYLVLCPGNRIARWLDLKGRRERNAAEERVMRSTSFPGFWIDLRALFEKDQARLVATLEEGIETSDHRNFIQWISKSKQ